LTPSSSHGGTLESRVLVALQPALCSQHFVGHDWVQCGLQLWWNDSQPRVVYGGRAAQQQFEYRHTSPFEFVASGPNDHSESPRVVLAAQLARSAPATI
jgi:hypothetical protein